MCKIIWRFCKLKALIIIIHTHIYLSTLGYNNEGSVLWNRGGACACVIFSWVDIALIVHCGRFCGGAGDDLKKRDTPRVNSCEHCSNEPWNYKDSIIVDIASSKTQKGIAVDIN